MTFSEILGLVSLNVAIVGVIIAFSTAIFNKKLIAQRNRIKSIDEALHRLQREEERLDEIIRAITKCYLIDDACEGSYEGVIERILEETNSNPDTAKRIVAAFNKNREDKIRAINELLLWSKDAKEKESAFRSLGEASGNMNSIRIMQKAIDYEPKRNDDLLLRAVNTLDRRLNNGG